MHARKSKKSETKAVFSQTQAKIAFGEKIIEAVCAHYCIDYDKLTSYLNRSDPDFVEPLHIAMHLIHVDTGLGLENTGKLLKRNSNTFVQKSVKRVEQKAALLGPILTQIRDRYQKVLEPA
jgi:chromosomal replication initiation ATPase DnaA